jgi:hypothetical protein
MPSSSSSFIFSKELHFPQYLLSQGVGELDITSLLSSLPVSKIVNSNFEPLVDSIVIRKSS